MGHVFVSYSRLDSEYADKLVDHLAVNGIECWIDRSNIKVGFEYNKAIRNGIELCDAFVVIMSSAGQESYWVQNELDWARRLAKPIRPLLLEGGPWFGLTTTHYEDVTGQRLPSRSFIALLPRSSGPSDGSPLRRLQPPEGASTSEYRPIAKEVAALHELEAEVAALQNNNDPSESKREPIPSLDAFLDELERDQRLKNPPKDHQRSPNGGWADIRDPTSYTAWDDNLYAWPPPIGWYSAGDGRWWPPGYGPEAGNEASPKPNEIARSGSDEWGKTPRNAPCPCGSGKKFKLCHGR